MLMEFNSPNAVVSHEMRVYSPDNRCHFVFFSNQRESVIDSFPDAKSTARADFIPSIERADLRGEREQQYQYVFDYKS